jgi:MtfA peptidase
VFFTWLKNRQRRKLRESAPLDEWRATLRENLWQFAALSELEQNKLCRDSAVFVAEKHWEGCNGLTISEEMKTLVAAQVALLTLGFGEQYFDRVRSVLLYPQEYEAPDHDSPGSGIVIESRSARIGEAWYRGPVILSWPDVEAGGRSPNGGHNLVVHEFAHQLDTLNGREADGVPVMQTERQAARWVSVCDRAFAQLQRACRGWGRPHMDCYGATDRAEFFAVASETFFQTPGRLANTESELFDVLREFYGQDPRRWAC